MSKPEFTISNSTGNNAEKHSRRYYIPFSVDESLSPNNIVIYDCGDDREHLNSTARPYIIAYNYRQKRKDRMKDYEDDYVGALENGRACYGKGDKKEKPFHHDIIQIGNRDVLGITDSDFDVKHWRELKRDRKKKEASGYVSKHLNKDEKVDEARVVVYARVSTEHEAQISALENQVQYYDELLGRHPEWVLVDRYIDEGISGTSIYETLNCPLDPRIVRKIVNELIVK